VHEIDEILKGDKNSLPKYIREIIKNVREGKYSPDDLAIPITLSKPLNQYGGTSKRTGRNIGTPDYAKGAIWAVENLGVEIFGGDRVKTLYCLRPTDVICYIDEEQLPKNTVLDYDKIIDKTIKEKSLQFLNLAGISWRDVEGHSNFGGWFN